MRNIILVTLVCVSTLFSMDLDEVLDKALMNSPSLESLNERISANRSSINISDQFSNPQLSYAQDTLDSKQAMSKKTFTLTQKIPFYGKRESLKKVALSQESVLIKSLDRAKAALSNAIKSQAYSIWELERVYTIICDYEALTKQNIDLHESYSSMSDNQHMGIMSAELTLSDLRIQKSALHFKIDAAYANLSYLAAHEITDFEIALYVSDMPGMAELQQGLDNNLELALKDKEIEIAEAKIEVAQLNNYPDLTFVAGYSSRENFDDYATFGVGVTLPIYGTEDYKEHRARKLSLAAKSMKEETRFSVSSRFQFAYAQMKSAYETYHIVHDEALPKIEHMFELTNSSISTGGDLFKYIDILSKKLKLEEKSIRAVANYNRAQAKIMELSGEMR